MRIVIAAAILFLLFLQAGSNAQEQEEIRIVTGKLTGYGSRAVFVDREKIPLCDEYEVLDTLEKAISIDGLVATEIVTVAIKNDCAFMVKAEKIRR